MNEFNSNDINDAKRRVEEMRKKQIIMLIQGLATITKIKRKKKTKMSRRFLFWGI